MARSFRWEPGQVLEVEDSDRRPRRYTLLALIGRDAASLVWLAEERDSTDEASPARRVAVRVLKPDAEPARDRFEREAGLLWALHEAQRQSAVSPVVPAVLARSAPGATPAYLVTEHVAEPGVIDLVLLEGASRALSTATFDEQLSLARARGDRRSSLGEDDVIRIGIGLCQAWQTLADESVAPGAPRLADARWSAERGQLKLVGWDPGPPDLAERPGRSGADPARRAVLHLASDLFWLCTLVRPPRDGAGPEVLARLGGPAWRRTSPALRLVLERALDPSPERRFARLYAPPAGGDASPLDEASLGGALATVLRWHALPAEELSSRADAFARRARPAEALALSELARRPAAGPDEEESPSGELAGLVLTRLGEAEAHLRAGEPAEALEALAAARDAVGPTRHVVPLRRGIEVAEAWLLLREALDLLVAESAGHEYDALWETQDEVRDVVDGLAGPGLDVLRAAPPEACQAVAEELATLFDVARNASQLGAARRLVEFERRLLGAAPTEHVAALWTLVERLRSRERERRRRLRRRVTEEAAADTPEGLRAAAALAGDLLASIPERDQERPGFERLVTDLRERARHRQEADGRDAGLRAARDAEQLGDKLVESSWPDSLRRAVDYFDRAETLYQQVQHGSGAARAARKREQAEQLRRLLAEAAGNAQVLETLLARAEDRSGQPGPLPFDRPLERLREACEELLAARSRGDYLEALVLVPVVVRWHLLVESVESAERAGAVESAAALEEGEPRTGDGFVAWLRSVSSPEQATVDLLAWVLKAAEAAAREAPQPLEAVLAGQRGLAESLRQVGDKVSALESAIGLLELPPSRPGPLAPPERQEVDRSAPEPPAEEGKPAVQSGRRQASLATPRARVVLVAALALVLAAALLPGDWASRAFRGAPGGSASATPTAPAPSPIAGLSLTPSPIAATPRTTPTGEAGRVREPASAVPATPTATPSPTPSPTTPPRPSATPTLGTPTALAARGAAGEDLGGVYVYVEAAQAVADGPSDRRVGVFLGMQSAGFTVAGRDRGGTALKVAPRDERLIGGWVRAEYVELPSGVDLEALPVVE